LKGVGLEKFPNGKGHPSPEDDRFWAAALDLDMPVAHHTSGGSTRMTGPDEPTFSYARGLKTSPGGPEWMRTDPMRHNMFRFCGDAACAPIQMAFAGVWDRFPGLRLYWAETNIGWLSYAYWQIDEHYERYGAKARDMYGWDELERRPSEYLQDHNLWGFLYDRYGVSQRHVIGIDNLMWGNDFPHVAGDWPHSQDVIEKNFAGVPDDERAQMLAGNAVRFFHLD
jgi:predicted TIM-barrel fold metal-dependent hydrolase